MLLIAVVLSGLLSALAFLLLGHSIIAGLIYGTMLGLMITFLALNFVSFMNYQLLPRLSKAYWFPIAFVFSFASGFIATLLSIYLYKLLGMTPLSIFETHPLIISFAVGTSSYIVAALLYRFVNVRNKKEQSDEDLIQSRLRSLETQLNPHFLFNALNSIAELIHQDQYKAETALLKVSAFLRNTMKEETLIPLQQEVDNLHAYIELENIRFNNMIKLRIDQEIPHWKVPKFSLQLLAENALKHGYKQSHQPLDITLTFNAHSIIIMNNGAPMSTKRFGIGLSNLNQRLRLLNQGELKVIETEPPTFEILLGETHENIDR